MADESGEASDAVGGALVEVGGVAGEGAGFVLLEVEGVFDVGDDVGEGAGLAVAGGEGAAVDEGGAPREYALELRDRAVRMYRAAEPKPCGVPELGCCLDLRVYAVLSYSLMRPLRMGRRLIRS